jgi:1D-myo-inositol 3-kinase
MHDLLVVGNYCHDELIHEGGKSSQTLGGSAAYISSIVSPLGVDFHVIAKVGEDFRYGSSVLRRPIVVSGGKTTRFTADFTSGERESRVHAVCAPITPSDITAKGRLTLACGVMGELLPETLEKLTGQSEQTFCDIQGLIRALDDEGRVLHLPLAQTAYMDLISRLTVLKVSRFESQFIDLEDVRQKTTVILTEGAKGCTVYEKKREFHVDAFPAIEVDPTGAGDCFIAGFAYATIQGLDFKESLQIANFCGAQAVSQVGVPRIDRESLAARRALLLKKNGH